MGKGQSREYQCHEIGESPLFSEVARVRRGAGGGRWGNTVIRNMRNVTDERVQIEHI